MNSTMRILLTLAATICLVPAALSMDEPGAKEAALRFMQKLVPETELIDKTAMQATLSRKGDSNGRWMIGTGHHMLIVQDQDAAVTYYSNLDLDNLANGVGLKGGMTGKPFYASDSDFLDRINLKLEQIGWQHGDIIDRKPLPKADALGRVPRKPLYVIFYERLNGYEVQGSGNRVLIGVDSLSGDILTVERKLGYVAGSATLNLTKEEAIERAREATKVSATPVVFGPFYRAMGVHGEKTSTRGEQFAKSKTLPLCYLVLGENEHLVIAADNGEVLSRRSGVAAGSGSSTPSVKQQSEGTARPAVPASRSDSNGGLIATCVGIALCLGLAFLAGKIFLK